MLNILREIMKMQNIFMAVQRRSKTTRWSGRDATHICRANVIDVCETDVCCEAIYFKTD
jgi:hypothetical protein